MVASSTKKSKAAKNSGKSIKMMSASSAAAKDSDHKKEVLVRSAKKPSIIYFPGSSGKVGKDKSDALTYFAEDYDVHVLQPEEGKGLWAVSKLNSPRNIDTALNFIKDTISVGEKWYLMASSFGIRVAAEILNGEHLQASELPCALVALGIPLFADSKGRDPNERVDHFRKSFPAEISIKSRDKHQSFRVLLCSGANDPCIKSKAPANGPTGLELLVKEKNTWKCANTTEIHLVKGGGHGVFDGSAGTTTCTEAFHIIKDFLSRA